MIRHAETEDNVGHIIQGQQDSPLTQHGIDHARRCLASLKSAGIDLVVSSPLGRAVGTAELLCSAIGMDEGEIVYESGFREIDLGSWTKQSKHSLPMGWGDDSYFSYKNRPACFRPRNGEDLYALQRRVTAAFDRVTAAYAPKTLAVVTHSVALRTLLLQLEHKPMQLIWNYRIAPVSITKVRLEGGVCDVCYIGRCPY